jgi:uncharacterized RDD family membrane protein YckC
MQQDAADRPCPGAEEAVMTTPEDPFANPGQPGEQPPSYGQPPPAQPAYGQPVSSAWQGPPLASWGTRAYGALIDYVAPFLLSYLVFFAINKALGSLLYLAAFGWVLYNAYQGGVTGQSYGKKVAGTRVLREQDGQVIGGGLGIGRYFLHIVDGFVCGLGYLWPLWDNKHQTFADKIVKTVVIKV